MTEKRRKPINFNRFIALVFLGVIVLGTVLLCLPVASRNGNSAGLKTALFTATSSTCVTGLVLGDTYTVWSPFGQAVILVLIEIGGLGFMSVASFVIFTLRRKVNMNTQLILAATNGAESVADAVRIQKKLLAVSLLTEALGALVLTFRFLKDFPFLRALKLGVFHAVSAYCNAGFDILGFRGENSSVSSYSTDKTVLITLAVLIIVGGLGFVVWDEILTVKSPKKWSVYTKLVLISTAILLVLGTVLLCFTEWNNKQTVGDMSVLDKITALFFQSATTRTAGFAGINQGALKSASKGLCIFLMLIGGSSSSTAGGLKTVTFVILVLFLVSRIKSEENVTVFHRTVSKKQVMNALTLFGIFVSLLFFGGYFISATSGVQFTDALFESVSALSTVGLTTGITPTLSTVSQLLLIVYMYFGRVGILTISFGFLQNTISNNKYKYAETNMLIG